MEPELEAAGAFVAPFVCQTLLARGIPWEHFYLGSLALSGINTTFLAVSFHPTRKELEGEGHFSSPSAQPCIEAQLEASPIVDDKSINRTDTILSEKTSSSSVSTPSGTRKRDCGSSMFVSNRQRQLILLKHSVMLLAWDTHGRSVFLYGYTAEGMIQRTLATALD